MAADTTGNKSLDAIRTNELCAEVISFSKKTLKPKGVLISKLFMGNDFIEVKKLAKLIFNDQVSVDLNYNTDTPRCPELIYKVNNKIIKNLRTSKKACGETISLIQRWHKDYWNYIPRSTRLYSDFYISKSNKL